MAMSQKEDMLPSNGSLGQGLALQNVPDMSVMVGNAIDHLQDLAKKLQNSEKAIISITDESVIAISDAINDLDKERLTCHEELEIETITASNLRHKLGRFPRDIEVEIRGAVASARDSNEAEINNLEQRILDANNYIAETEHKWQLISVENSSLGPQREQLQLQYEQTIAYLNQSLADKASLQIQLNETRKKLKETREEIADLEKAMNELGEEMVDEREEARLEKARLENLVISTTQAVEEQKNTNLSLKSEIEEVETKAGELEIRIKEKASKLRQFEQSIARLEGQGYKLTAHLQNQVEENSKLTKEGMDIVKKSTEGSQKLKKTEEELRAKLAEVSDEAAKAAREFDRLHAERIKVLNELDMAKSSGSKGKDEALEVDRKLRRVKDDLMHNTRECVRLKQENEDLESAIERIKQEHQASMEILNKQANDLGVSLGAERKERLELQNRRDSLIKESSGYKNDYSHLMVEVNTHISDGKEEHKKLTEEGSHLQRDLKQDELDIKNRQQTLHQAKVDFVTMQKRLKGEISKYEESIESLGKQIIEAKERLTIEKPKFEELEGVFAKKTDEFEAKKKSVVELKNKKASLETSVDRIQAEIERIENPMPSLREELKDAKSKYFDKLAQQTEEIKQKENEICIVQEKLSRLYTENKRFTESITKLEREQEDLNARIKSIIGGEGKIEENISRFKALIEETWKEDVRLDKEYYEKDLLLLDDIVKMQEFTKTREKRIELIYDRLDQELEGLSWFINHVAGHRPPSSEDEIPM